MNASGARGACTTDYKALIKLLASRKVYIQTHNFPDPDAIASAFGLQRFLRHFSINSKLCCDGQIDKLSTKRMLATFDIQIHPGYKLKEMTLGDYIVLVDTQALVANRTNFIGEEVACIDHHPVFSNCKYRYEDIRPAGACASLIAQYYQDAGIAMDEDVATALVYGIKMDTAEFSRGVTALDVDMFAFAFRSADTETLAGLYTNSMELRDLRAYAAAIDSITLYGTVGFAYLPFPCPDATIAIICDFILSLDVVDVAVVYSMRPNGLKCSVRSERANVNAGVVIGKALLGVGSGGGHSSMAGGFIPQSSLPLLGEDVNAGIKQRFLDVIPAMDNTDSSLKA